MGRASTSRTYVTDATKNKQMQTTWTEKNHRVFSLLHNPKNQTVHEVKNYCVYQRRVHVKKNEENKTQLMNERL